MIRNTIDVVPNSEIDIKDPKKPILHNTLFFFCGISITGITGTTGGCAVWGAGANDGAGCGAGAGWTVGFALDANEVPQLLQNLTSSGF